MCNFSVKICHQKLAKLPNLVTLLMTMVCSLSQKGGEGNEPFLKCKWAWSSLVEGDEQLIGPTVKQLWNYVMHVLHNFFGLNVNTTAFCLGRSSLHLLLLKSSMKWANLRRKLWRGWRTIFGLIFWLESKRRIRMESCRLKIGLLFWWQLRQWIFKNAENRPTWSPKRLKREHCC